MPTRSTPSPRDTQVTRSTPSTSPGPAAPDTAALATELRRREEARRRQLDELARPAPDPVRLAYRDSVVRALAQVREALSRLENGTYGQCACCGAPIPPTRLEAVPTATRCVPCEVDARST